MSPPARADEIEVFGPYEVYECLGKGGMASVHRAKKVGIEGFARVVALKRLLSHLAEDDGFIRSFVREARLASHLQHANIVQIYDLGRVDKVYYIAMEFIRGRDLRRILKQTAYATGPMPVPMVLALAMQLCDALDYAHNLADERGEPLGIVHRDISPSNAIVAADGHLKLIDFGIAKATSNTLRTQTGRVKGKFAYMAPEAVHGQPLDKRSDIFATGIVVWELTTARPLFASKSEYDTLRKVTKLDIKPPSHYNPSCPPDLDEIVMTALAKSPEARWQSTGAMHAAMAHVVKERGLQASNREIQQWLTWAFEQPLQDRRVQPGAVAAAPESPARKAMTLPPDRPAMQSPGPVGVDQLDSVSIEIAWGSGRDSEQTQDHPADPSGAIGATGAPAAAGADRDERSGPSPLVAGAAQEASHEAAALEARSTVRGHPPLVGQPTPSGASGAAAAAAAGGGAAGDDGGSTGGAIPSDAATTIIDAEPPPMLREVIERVAAERAAQEAASDHAVTLMDSGEWSRERRRMEAIFDAGPPPPQPAPGSTPSQTAPGASTAQRRSGGADTTARVDGPDDGPSSGKARAVLRVALVVLLCAAAAVGGFLLVPGGGSGGAGSPSQAASPPIVAAESVTRRAGEPPVVSVASDGERPPVVRARVCIDRAGAVTSVAVAPGTVPAAVAAQIEQALRGWRYEPFEQDGAALAVCFDIDAPVRYE